MIRSLFRSIVVVHDLGSVLGLDWAQRHRNAVKAIVHMEALLGHPTREDWPEDIAKVFLAIRSELGEELVLKDNALIEEFLPSSVLRELTDEEMGEYRRPFAEAGEARRSALSWVRQMPLDGHPSDVQAIVDRYSDWLRTSEIPKLFINADPGLVLSARQRADCRMWPNQVEVTVPGLHLVQEDSPNEIGSTIADWYALL